MDFVLPDIGEGILEGELIRWLVKEGDAVNADQPVLEVMTDKATVEVPSPIKGVIKNLKGKEGDMIKVGSKLADVEGGGAAATTAAPSSAPAAAPAKAPVAPAAAAPVASAPAAAPAVSTMAYQSPVDSFTASSVPAAPIVRAMAQKSGVDLSQVPGSGPDVGGRNRVLEEDLMRFLSQKGSGAVAAGPASYSPAAVASESVAAKKAPAAQPIPANFPRYIGGPVAESVERKPVRGLRRVIAQAMVKSKYTAPHYSYVDEFECSNLVEIREYAKVAAEKYGVKLTYLPFVIKAVVGALRDFPEVNSSLEETANGLELVVKKHLHIGFAVATNDGLVVPVIKHADRKSLLEIAREMTELSNKVRAGKASSEELKGSTFSITSMGNIGGLFATPIINYPEVGILGVYKIQEKPVVQNGQIVVGKTMHLSLSLDHRVVDGAVGGHFCNAIIERLSNPGRLMLEMV